MTLKEYIREYYLMNKQYGQEEELYPLINILLRQTIQEEGISIRDIHNARLVMNSPGRQVLKGYGSFPDIVILSENFDVTKSQKENLDCLLGCIEAKTEINGDKYAIATNASIIANIIGGMEEKNVKIRKFEVVPKWSNVLEKEAQQVLNSHEVYYFDVKDEYLCMYPETKNAHNYVRVKVSEFKKNSIDDIQTVKMNGKNVIFKIFTRTYEIDEHSDFDKHIQQIVGQLDMYGKVIYTDGIKWILFKKESGSTEKKIYFSYRKIGELFSGENNTKIREEFEEKCKNGLNEKYNSFADFWKALDKERLIDEWYNLMSNLSKIKWKKKSNV